MASDRRNKLPERLERLSFSEGILSTVVGGSSPLDLQHLNLTDRHEAERFLNRYGYDLGNPDHRNEIERVRSEALGFVRGILVRGLDLDVPQTLDTRSVLDLLMLAAQDPNKGDTDQQIEQAWACTMLRVMHTVAHAGNYFQTRFYQQIREAVLERFVGQVRSNENGTLVLVGRTCDVPLVRFEVKETKPVRSIVLKLLQKEGNVAHDLFDHIGVRIIVSRPVEALYAVRALHEQHTIMFANIKPTRSRNTLIDIAALQREVARITALYEQGQIDETSAIASLMAFNQSPAGNAQVDWNPHSSSKYNSIQFTCRQMIRFRNPLAERLSQTRQTLSNHLTGDALQEVLRSLDRLEIDKDIQFFFPYEVQIMDVASYEQATRGRAAYNEYKRRQIVTARGRVMKRVLRLVGLPTDGGPCEERAPTGPMSLRETLYATHQGGVSSDPMGQPH